MSAFVGIHSFVDSLMFARLVYFVDVIRNMAHDWTYENVTFTPIKLMGIILFYSFKLVFKYKNIHVCNTIVIPSNFTFLVKLSSFKSSEVLHYYKEGIKEFNPKRLRRALVSMLFFSPL